MKYLSLILLFAFQANAKNYSCSGAGEEEIFKIFGLSETPEIHKAVVQLAGFGNLDFGVQVETPRIEEFLDWGGPGLILDRRIRRSSASNPDIHYYFDIDLRQKVGGHCEDFRCPIKGFYNRSFSFTQPVSFTCSELEEVILN